MLWVACALVLAAVAALARVEAATIARRAAVVLPLVLLAAASVPFLHPGGTSVDLGPLTLHEAGLATLATVPAKAAIGTLSAVLLGATTTVPLVARALGALGAPRLFTLTALLTYRYAFVLADEAARTCMALVARGHRPEGLRTTLTDRGSSRGRRCARAVLHRWAVHGRRRPLIDPLTACSTTLPPDAAATSSCPRAAAHGRPPPQLGAWRCGGHCHLPASAPASLWSSTASSPVTTASSSWLPAHASSSRWATSGGRARRYGRSVTMAS